MTTHHAPAIPKGFTAPDTVPGALSADAAARILGAVGDITLVVDRDGVVLDTAIADRDLAQYGVATWIGRAWSETVTIESRPKVAEMIAGAGDEGRWRQVNHVTDNGEVPIRYLTMALGDGRLIAVGRDMRSAAATQQRLLQTQQSLERDYIRLRQAEARYRMLFDLAHEPVLIVDAASRRIREANPAAHRLLGVKDGALANQPVTAIVAADAREALVGYLGAAEAVEGAAPATMRLARQGGVAQIAAKLFRQARVALLLVRIEPLEAAANTDVVSDARLADVVERMPDAFVLVDGDMAILAANAAFVELTQAPSADRLIGASLGDWLGRPGIDLDLILGQIREHGAVRNVATILRSSGGGQEEIEVSGVAASDAHGACFGFTIRDVGRRLRAIPEPGLDLPRSVDQLTQLVGRMSLKEIVRESTDLIERLCIEAALAYTDDNRASAAEILGVSRQSLYSKLHRHGLGSLPSGPE
ncbi:Transcriptional regulator PpsR [Sphingomonas sp. EC-HK361]|uniref:transcriptional regulator PpsR n=1 Tax=Sphingomonas sp. EC-HK361 TaxID=2038397 RepID=UPI0012548A7D|nr:transcriptional regulator PpsR [Sphingomonas sp. EC-HK361]VVS99967.1 Transcriptional regulator PpsR [Sphingomonas sp. EC-HK361]